MKFIGLLASILLVSSCSILNTNKVKTKTIWVNSEKVDCTGVTATKCIQIQESEKLKEDWTTFSATIEGFKYQEGYIYQLEIAESKIPAELVPADGASIKYTLIKIVQQYPDIKEDGIYAHIETSLGHIVGKLEYEKAPLTVANFVGLAEGTLKNTAKAEGVPYFDSLIFHRVIPSFMIQGGDPTGTGAGGPGYKFKNENHPDLNHNKAGTFSMANAGANTNGSQFFITHKPTPFLNGNYNVFGNVILGQDVVVAIGNTPRFPNDRPKTPVYMTVKIIRIGDAAEKYDANETFLKYK